MNTLPPLIGRQKLLASYLYLMGADFGKTIKFKHLLLISKEFRGNFHYDFVPYKYGAYSFTMANDLDVLEQKGIHNNINALKEYFISMSEKDQLSLVNFFDTYKNIIKNKNETIKFTYEKYPYFALNSSILYNYPLARNRVEKIKKHLLAQKEEILFTIGYESKSIEVFFNQLIENNIKTLVDVRANRHSMKFGFSESTLSKIREGLGIEYVGLSELGIESEKRKSLDSMQDYEELFIDYKKSLKSKGKYLLKLENILKDKNRIALMCFEFDPKMCHRTVLAKELLKRRATTFKEL